MAHNNRKVLGILTSGGDCPGLNAVIRAVVKTALNDYGMDAIGYKDGYHGLVTGKCYRLRNEDVSGIMSRGGTILGTSNTHDPFRWAEARRGKLVALRGNDLISVPLKQVAGRLSLVPTDHPLIAAARAVGTSFGD